MSETEPATETESPRETFTAPLWLLGAPASADVPWTWAPPTLDNPVSQLCTQDQMAGPLYERLCAHVRMYPNPHRKVWEFIYIFAALGRHLLLTPGSRLLGFGVGEEPLPSVFASFGAQVVATDAPSEVVAGEGWDSTGQHASELAQLHRPDIVPAEEFQRLVSFEPVDMNAIPDHLTGFDACWSACAFEHLGSLDHGLDFVENSLKTLRIGGIAIHTTEFNLSSNEETFEEGNLAIYRRTDIERLIERLTRKGHKVAPLNLFPGSTPVDEHVDLPPYALPHLKLKVAGYVTTSIGLIIERGV
jgi:hypothetical protein